MQKKGPDKLALYFSFHFLMTYFKAFLIALNPAKSVAAISASIFLLRETPLFLSAPMNFEYEVSSALVAAEIL